MVTMDDFKKMTKEEQANYLKTVEEMQALMKADAAGDSGLKQLSMAQLKEIFTESIAKALKPLTDVDRKYFAAPGVDPKILDRLDDEAKFLKTTQFLNCLVKGDAEGLKKIEKETIEAGQARRKAAYMNESTGSEGAYLVPEEFSNEILRLTDVYGVVRANARILPMKYDTLHVPAALGDPSTHWTNEASQIYGTAPTFREIILNVKKLATLPTMTNEFLEDANVDIINYLADLIAMQLAIQEDTQGLIGVGSPFVGVINGTGCPTYIQAGTGFECLSYQDLVKLPSRIKTSAQANAKYYLHRSMIAQVHSLITTAGAPIFPGAPNSILGYPMVSSEVLPGIGHTAYQTDATTYAIFGDLRKALLMGERGSLRMKLITEGTVGANNLAEKDMVALRVIERICFGVALPSAVCIIKS